MKGPIFYTVLLYFLLMMLPMRMNAQNTPQNLAAWIGYELYLPFKENGRWGLLLEGYAKGNRFVSQLQGAFYRIGANYYTKKGNRFGAGYAYQWNIPYDKVSLPYSNPDYRIYEQFIWRIPKKNGDIIWTQRFRMEQRWLGRKDAPDYSAPGFDYYKFENTFRYLLRYQWWFRSRWAFVTYEERKAGDMLEDEVLAPGVVSNIYVTAAAHAARGAWPFGVPGVYGADDLHLSQYAKAAKTRAGFQRYLDEWVLTPRKSSSPA